MTKELLYDLDFRESNWTGRLGITPLTTKGIMFLYDPAMLGMDMQSKYAAAVKIGLHVRFENANVRDMVIKT